MPEHGIIKNAQNRPSPDSGNKEHGIYYSPSLCQIVSPASSIAASFGKVNSRKLSEYKAEDLAAAPVNSFTYNTG